MITLAQRIRELRTEKGLSCPGLSAALGFPRNAIEKFETGRQTPSKAQQEKMAGYFGVSLFYLKGESNDRTRQETWMDAVCAEEDESIPVPVPPKSSRPAPQSAAGQSATVFDSLLTGKPFQDMVRATLLDILRSPEGEELVARVVKKELDRRR